MNKGYVRIVIEELEGLRANLYLAKRTKDGRSREKNIREAKLAISNYAAGLTNDIRGFLDTEVDANALSFKWADGDIDRCIRALKDWLVSQI